MAGLSARPRRCPPALLLAAALAVGALSAGLPLKIAAASELVPEVAAQVQDLARAETEAWHGEASWYGPGLQGRRTASGERFDREALTAAHPSLPFGTVVRVENMRSGRSVEVRINDRGPFAKRNRSRIIDLSEAAARVLGVGRKAGVAPVRITIVPQERR